MFGIRTAVGFPNTKSPNPNWAIAINLSELFGFGLKAQKSVRKPNLVVFGFRRSSDFGRSEFGHSLYYRYGFLLLKSRILNGNDLNIAFLVNFHAMLSHLTMYILSTKKLVHTYLDSYYSKCLKSGCLKSELF